MGDEQGPKTPEKRFMEIHDSRARVRDVRGRWRGVGTLAKEVEESGVKRSIKARDYRKFLEAVEPRAMKVLADALRDKRIPLKDRLLVAQDVLNRLHGKALVPVEADAARRRVEQMSTDELRDYIKSVASEVGLMSDLLPVVEPRPMRPKDVN
jgi:hypothetical protein